MGRAGRGRCHQGWYHRPWVMKDLFPETLLSRRWKRCPHKGYPRSWIGTTGGGQHPPRHLPTVRSWDRVDFFPPNSPTAIVPRDPTIEGEEIGEGA